ncbi:MAG: hypothetical protein ACLVL7_12840 [Anaerotruncus massiliensis (ex Togo et al. 2019)]
MQCSRSTRSTGHSLLTEDRGCCSGGRLPQLRRGKYFAVSDGSGPPS